MILKRSPLSIKDNIVNDPDDSKDYPTIADLMREQKVSKKGTNTVHYRRDLDSLG